MGCSVMLEKVSVCLFPPTVSLLSLQSLGTVCMRARVYLDKVS